ncbi:hypothetical protein [Aminobacterium sp. MB27-C1]|jgi:hypothetical protein|uniref:hypothetical protein n=1 Tax=unclassified Aminobacterium TaxID=2685012 RepID=UPI0035A6D87B
MFSEEDERKQETFLSKVLFWSKAFTHGTFVDKRMAVVRKEAFDVNDNLMLLLFGDFLGIPNPISYYMLEILPYFAEDLVAWERRMQNRKFIIAEKASQYDFD